MAEKSNYVDKKFGFTKVIWEVKNFCVSKDVKTWRIYSPELVVKGFHLTKWSMILMRNFVADDDYVVQFRLKREKCGDFSDKVSVDCVLEYSDRQGCYIEQEFQHHFFEVNQEFDKTLLHADFTPINDIHTNVFVLEIEILVYVSGIIEAVQSCENIGIKRLSEDLHNLYESGVCRDLKLQSQQHAVNTHKTILFHRIKNQEFRNKISNGSEINVDNFKNEPVDRVVRFLYTGNIQHAVILPSIAVFKFAQFLDVEPIVAYYNPDKIIFTTSFDMEEYCVTWTLDYFLNLREKIISSPQMTNNAMDAKWCLKVYPQGLSKKEKMIGIYFDIQTETKMSICVDFFLAKVRGGERISYKRHKLISGRELFGDKDFIELDKAKAEYMSNGSLTIGLKLRIGYWREDFSVGKSIAANQYFSGQKNYYRLSKDILSLFHNGRFHDMTIYFKEHNSKFHFHECILSQRCSSLLYAFRTNNLTLFNNVNVVVMKELFNFLYSGQLNENIILEDIFCLYDTSNNFNFVALSTVIIERLKESLTESSALTIFDFSNARNIDDLRNSALNYIESKCFGHMIFFNHYI